MTDSARSDRPRSDAIDAREAGGGTWFDAFFDALLPDSFRGPGIPLRSQARFNVGVLLLSSAIAVSILVGRSGQGVHALYAFAVAVLASSLGLIAAFRLGAPRFVIATSTMGLLYVGSVGLVVASGGEAIAAVMVASLLPIVAYAVEGRRAAIAWAGAVLFGIAFTAVYAQSTDEFLYSGDLLAWNDWRFSSMVLMVGFMLLAALGVDWLLLRSREETEELQAQIRSQSERYRDLVENVGDCMMEYDERFRCIYASPNWQEMMGRAPETLLGRGYLDCLDPREMSSLERENAALVAEPGTTTKYRSRVRHTDGRWIEGEVSARTFRARNGELHMVTIFRDLSDLYRAERALRHNDRLVTAGTLAAGIAHQINNPIGAIRNASEYALLTADETEVSEIKGVLETNIEQAARCGEIVRSLLQFASREHAEKKPQDLREVVERACAFAQSFGGERLVQVEIDLGSVALPAEISAIEVEQVVVNLVQNAIESRPRSRRVVVLARREADEVVVEVDDDGCGISESDLAQVFDPFFTTRLSDGGTGLGMSVALGIAREHGGTIEIDSEEGVGTRVRLRLPAI